MLVKGRFFSQTGVWFSSQHRRQHTPTNYVLVTTQKKRQGHGYNKVYSVEKSLS